MQQSNPNYKRGVWYDWMYHILWKADNTGFLEVYVRESGAATNYTLLWSKYNYPTEYIGYTGQTVDNNAVRPRIGMYRSSAIGVTQTIYIYNPKIGTTRADVEYVGTPTTDTTTPSISIACPGSGNTYSSQTISVSGTASDASGISKVEVKAGNSAWKTATGTTSWSVSGLTLANGANTVTARATDTSGNTKETSIIVTYSASATPPTGTLLWSDKFSPDDTHKGPLGWGGSMAGWGDFDGWYCEAKEDALSIVDASTLPGGRTGYVLKAKQGPSPDYDCGSDGPGQHATMELSSGQRISTITYPEQWWGYSIMLDPSWVPETGSYWQSFGMSATTDIFVPNTGYKLVMFAGTDNPLVFVGYNEPWKSTGASIPLKGQWYDVLFNMKWSNTNTGWSKVYLRAPGAADYTLIYSRSGYSNLKEGSTHVGTRVGMYRGYNPLAPFSTTQIMYIGYAKIGTIRASAEYNPSSGNPAPTCTAPTTNPDPNPQPTITSLSLKPGWNQISSPVAAGIDLSAIESSCTILPYKNQKLWAWNAQTQLWTNPAKVEPFKGYWIYAAYQCTVPLSGTLATFSTLQLYNGWNKISASGTFSAIQGTCAGHITGNWVWHWDKATEKWIHPTTMQLGKGYWIKVDQNCVLGA